MRLWQAVPVTILPFIVGLLGAADVVSTEPPSPTQEPMFTGAGTFSGSMLNSGGSRSKVEFHLQGAASRLLFGDMTKLSDGKTWPIHDGSLSGDTLIFFVGSDSSAKCTLVCSEGGGDFGGPCCDTDGQLCPITLRLVPVVEAEGDSLDEKEVP